MSGVWRNRISRLMDLIQENELSAILIHSEANIFYFTGYRGPGYLLIPLNGSPKLYVYPLDFELARMCVRGGVEVEELSMTARVENVVEGLPDEVKSRLGFDSLNAEDYLRLSALLSHESLKPASEIVWKLRMIKDRSEIGNIEKACDIASKVMDLASEMLEDGVMESEVKAEVLEEMLKLGADGASFDIIVASGSRSSMPHGAPGSRVMRNGDVVVVDLGAVFEGYCSDMTRTFYIGGDPPEEVAKIYEMVLEAKRLAEESVKPWTLSSALYDKVYDRFAAMGYADYFIHGLGHGVGIEVHEPPRISKAGKEMIQENMVITIEPGIYLPGKFGIRLEDTLLVEKDGVRRLTSAPYTLTPY